MNSYMTVYSELLLQVIKITLFNFFFRTSVCVFVPTVVFNLDVRRNESLRDFLSKWPEEWEDDVPSSSSNGLIQTSVLATFCLLLFIRFTLTFFCLLDNVLFHHIWD